MTIGLGCLCGDGLILGADTQLTAVGYHKNYGSKIRVIHGDGFWDVAFAYAGSPAFADDFGDRLEEILLDDVGASADVTVIRDAVSSVLGRYAESDVHASQLLIGARIPPPNDYRTLMRTSGYSVSFQPGPAFVGAGDSSAVAFALPLMSRFGIETIPQAVSVSITLIEIAKKYVDGCGGETEILVVPYEGPISLLGRDQVAGIQSTCESIESLLADLLSRTLTPDGDKDALAKVIESVAAEVPLANQTLSNLFSPSNTKPTANLHVVPKGGR